MPSFGISPVLITCAVHLELKKGVAGRITSLKLLRVKLALVIVFSSQKTYVWIPKMAQNLRM